MDDKDKCQKCKGKKFTDQKTTIEVSVEPGVPHEHDYIYTAMADDIPGNIFIFQLMYFRGNGWRCLCSYFDRKT
jgi:DnaJ-class molecular chaperone